VDFSAAFWLVFDDCHASFVQHCHQGVAMLNASAILCIWFSNSLVIAMKALP
jgi:hypothetical protein